MLIRGNKFIFDFVVDESLPKSVKTMRQFKKASVLALNLIDDFLIEILKEYKIKQRWIDEVTFSFSCLMIDDKKMKKLNRKFRNKNKTTDVLSFQLHDWKDLSSEIKNSNSKIYIEIGDIFISYYVAQKEALAADRLFEIELVELFIHGLLHLLGMDHENVSKQKANKMLMLQKDLFENIIGDIYGRNSKHKVK